MKTSLSWCCRPITLPTSARTIWLPRRTCSGRCWSVAGRPVRSIWAMWPLASTKVRANASKHKAMCYGRMKEKEDQLSSEVAELLWRGEEVDDKEDRRYGRDRRGVELPEELAYREGRLRKIREAKGGLEAEARAQAE